MDDSDNNALLDPTTDTNISTVELNNQPSQQLRRIMIESFDIQLHNHVIFNSPHFSKISLSAPEVQNAIENNLNFKFINLQGLQIITSNQSGAKVYYRNMNNASQSTTK